MNNADEALVVAVKTGNFRATKYALHAGGNPNVQVTGELPLLHAAAMSPFRGDFDCCRILKLLLSDHRIDPNAREPLGGTPLVLALEKDAHGEHVGILLHFGADPTLTDDENMNAFDYALCGKKDPDVTALRQLLDFVFKKKLPVIPHQLSDVSPLFGLCEAMGNLAVKPEEDDLDKTICIDDDERESDEENLAEKRLCKLALDGDIVTDDDSFHTALSCGSVASELQALCEEEKILTQREIMRRRKAAGLEERANLSDVEWIAEKRKWLPENPILGEVDCKFPRETRYLMKDLGFLDIGKMYEPLELAMVKSLEKSEEPSKRFGCSRSCFNYLLLDSRVTQNLPVRDLTPSEKFGTFLCAIFYIGKGQKNRPYQHLKEAVLQKKQPKVSDDKKFQKIQEIWDHQSGIISLHVFHSQLHNEALTREAIMIDAVGLENLTNAKRGHKHGVVRKWPPEQQRSLGVKTAASDCQKRLGFRRMNALRIATPSRCRLWRSYSSDQNGMNHRSFEKRSLFGMSSHFQNDERSSRRPSGSLRDRFLGKSSAEVLKELREQFDKERDMFFEQRPFPHREMPGFDHFPSRHRSFFEDGNSFPEPESAPQAQSSASGKEDSDPFDGKDSIPIKVVHEYTSGKPPSGSPSQTNFSTSSGKPRENFHPPQKSASAHEVPVSNVGRKPQVYQKSSSAGVKSVPVSVLREEPVPESPAKRSSFEQITSVENALNELSPSINCFSGLKSSKEYMYLDEMLTRNLIRLDVVETHGDDEIRTRRKQVVKQIQGLVERLEALAMASMAPPEPPIANTPESLIENSTAEPHLSAKTEESPTEVSTPQGTSEDTQPAGLRNQTSETAMDVGVNDRVYDPSDEGTTV
ncbi:unnamed protein product [Notodromas monacha]|uniref:BAG domain-containing protein n=1 Tax=Notodromas monacha TaxID=399045 RepID=A0A7R9BM20_9CRUS|nr:unnamed protein product [Notodromas monacha]CAG0916634.1 unnamed protein product [Notodromas monacha]